MTVPAPRLLEPLPADRCREYEEIAMAVLQQAMSQYVEHTRRNHHVDKMFWKVIKAREDIKIYSARDRPVNCFPTLRGRKHAEWQPVSSLLCVGRLPGTVEDALYGTSTPTELAMATRSMLIQDEFTHHRVLQNIKLPSVDEPFQHVGLKWAKRSSRVSSIVKARDLVYVEASGYLDITRDGVRDRVGYMVCHSVEIPELSQPSGKQVIRGRMSLCSIFSQKASDRVDAFATLFSNPGGSLPPKLSAISGANALVAGASVMQCALRKKLVWLLTRKSEEIVKDEVVVVKVRGANWCCLQCMRGLSSFSSLSACEICHSTFCSRCISTQRLAIGSTPEELVERSVKVCVGCLSKAMWKVDSKEAAMEEFVLDSHTPCRRRAVSFLAPDWEDRVVEFAQTASTAVSSPVFRLSKSKVDCIDTPAETSTESDLMLLDRSRVEVPSDHEYSEIEDESDEEFQEDYDSDVELVTPVRVPNDDRVQLLQRMARLNEQAEMTYRYTKTQALHLHSLHVDSTSEESDK